MVLTRLAGLVLLGAGTPGSTHVYQHPQPHSPPLLEEGISGVLGVLGLLRGRRHACFVCGACAGFPLCGSGRLTGSSLQTFELKLHIH